MSVRVRFAPSPTGHLHIGGARTALYNYLFAKAFNGSLVLRIEDTDLERSTREFEQEQISDLQWLGIEFSEGPNNPGKFGPYRQSERLDLYREEAFKLVVAGKAFRCFCTEEELEAKKEKAVAEGKPPHYDGTCKNLDQAIVDKKLSENTSHTIRFSVPGQEVSIVDGLRGEVKFPADMVGDFVILRSNNMPVYNFCCVVDDAKMEISHVIRGEDHLNNTLRQQMIYEALGYEIPDFIHCSLLIGHDRQKLSKRHGATSLQHYKNAGYLPEAINNYLVLLGWSHPEEKDVFELNSIVEFFQDIKRFSKSSAIYDVEKLRYVNSEHLKLKNVSELKSLCETAIPQGHNYYNYSEDWKNEVLTLFQKYISFPADMISYVDGLFSTERHSGEEEKEISNWETTASIQEYLGNQVESVETDFVSIEKIDEWMSYLKKELKIKGKPLFKGARYCLTGKAEGADLKTTVKLTPIEVLKKRFK